MQWLRDLALSSQSYLSDSCRSIAARIVPNAQYHDMSQFAMGQPLYLSTGSDLTDTYSGSSKLSPEHFGSYHTYSVLWEPGEYVRWYLDDEFLMEVNKEALRAQVMDLIFHSVVSSWYYWTVVL